MSLRPSGASRVMKTPKSSKVRLGSAVVNASDIKGLRYAWRKIGSGGHRIDGFGGSGSVGTKGLRG